MLFGDVSSRLSTVTVLDDMEGASPLSNYSGSTGSYGVETSNPLEGSQSIASSNTFVRIAYDADTSSTPRGWEYRCLFEAPSSSEVIRFGTNVQDATDSGTINDDCYHAVAHTGNDTIGVQKFDAGSGGSVSTNAVTLNQGTTYQVGLRVEASAVTAVVYDESGTELQTSPELSDSDHGTGTFTFETSDSGSIFDYVTQRALP